MKDDLQRLIDSVGLQQFEMLLSGVNAAHFELNEAGDEIKCVSLGVRITVDDDPKKAALKLLGVEK